MGFCQMEANCRLHQQSQIAWFPNSGGLLFQFCCLSRRQRRTGCFRRQLEGTGEFGAQNRICMGFHLVFQLNCVPRLDPRESVASNTLGLVQFCHLLLVQAIENFLRNDLLHSNLDEWPYVDTMAHQKAKAMDVG